MKKHKLILLLCLIFLLVACQREEVKDTKVSTKISQQEKNDDEKKTKKVIHYERNVDYFTAKAELNFLNKNSYQLIIPIKQVDQVIFDNKNQYVYADIQVFWESHPSSISLTKDIKDPRLIPIALIDQQIPKLTKIVIDQDSDILSKEEHEAIQENRRGLSVSVVVRDPEGYRLLKIENTVFGYRNPTKNK